MPLDMAIETAIRMAREFSGVNKIHIAVAAGLTAA